MQKEEGEKSMAHVSVTTPLLLAYVLVSAAFFDTGGHYKYEAVLTVFGVYLVLLATYVLCIKKRISLTPPSTVALAATLLAILYIPSIRVPALYIVVPSFTKYWHITLLIAGGLVFTAYILPLTRKEWWRVTVFVLACVAAAGFRFGILHASPNPKIDVFTLNQSYTRVLLEGKNPYDTKLDIPDTKKKNSGLMLQLTGYDYLPGNLVLFVASQLFSFDTRLATVLAELSAALLLYLAVRERLSKKHAELCCLLFLFQPSFIFVTEEAWMEPFMFPFLLVFLLQARKKYEADAAAALGFILCLKQYMVFLPFQALLLLKKRSSWLTAAGVMAIVIGPFFLWNPQSFLENTVFYFFRLAARSDSLSVAAFLSRNYGVSFPTSAAIGLSAVVAMATTYLGSRFFERTTGFLFSLMLTMYTMFVFATQSFANYYYFLCFLILCLLCFQTEKTEAKS